MMHTIELNEEERAFLEIFVQRVIRLTELSLDVSASDKQKLDILLHKLQKDFKVSK